MDDILEQAHDLRRTDVPFALATVVRVTRPASARPGAKALVMADGAISGWVGGSCAQPAVAREGLASLADGRPRLLCLVGTDGAAPERGEGVVVQPMTCHSGGTIEVYIEPFVPRSRLLLFGESADDRRRWRRSARRCASTWPWWTPTPHPSASRWPARC